MSADLRPLLETREVAVGWGGRTVLSGVTFTLTPGGALVLVGPNGSGKSTLLRALLGLSPPVTGKISRSDEWRAGYVPQNDGTEPLLRLSAGEVVAMAARSSWLPLTGRAARRNAASRALSAVGIADLAAHSLHDLSGGQQQRVMLARALAAEPSVLVLDEPTTGLDLRAERELMDLVRGLRDERQLAVIIVTHSIELARREATSVGFLHDGRFHYGEPDELLAPERLEAVYGVAP